MAEYCKVVIIDDEFIMRQGMKHMLDWEKEGFQINTRSFQRAGRLEVIERDKTEYCTHRYRDACA